MPRLDSDRLELAKAIQAALAKENILTPIQARSFVRCLQTTWDVEQIRWDNQDSSGQLSSAYNLIHVAGIFRDVEGVNSIGLVHCYRRAAEQLEWLARADDDLKNEVPIPLLAGAAYQLGGLPAMAKGLLKQLQPEDAGWRLFSSFLQADFDAVIKTVTSFWGESPELSRKDASTDILIGGEDDSFSWYITVELTRTIGLISYSLRSGDQDRLEIGLKKLNSMQRLAPRALTSDMSLLITMLSEVANGFNEASIYKATNRLSEMDPTSSDKLNMIARSQYQSGRGILWSSQLAGVERLLKQSSFALCTPTGSGKTLVANLVLIKELLLKKADPLEASLAIYLVPSRALAGEVEAKLSREMGNELIVTGLYSGNDLGITDYWMAADRPTVLIATVEKAEAMMRYLGPIIVSRLKLLIIDEAHQVVPDDPEYAAKKFAKHTERSLRLESFVSRVFALLPDVVRVALTAVAGGAGGPIANWVESKPDASQVGLNYRSTRQVIGVLETRSGSAPKINLDLMNGAPLSVVGRSRSPYLNLRIQAMPKLPATMRDSINRYNQLEILWTSLHFRLKGQRILISLAQAPEQTMKWYCDAISLEDWTKLAAFDPTESSAQQKLFSEALATCIDYCGEDSYELKLLKIGIATSHGQMPQRLRLLMTSLIVSGICSITIATSTLSEGVNLPFDIIFLPELRRRSFDPDEEEVVIVPFSTSEFRNLSGRAGRPGAARSMEGLTLVALPQVPSTTAQSKIKTQKKQLKVLRNDYLNLRERLVAEERRIESVESPLALLIETIFLKAKEIGLIGDTQAFLDWLDRVSPGDISEDAATGHGSKSARLADTLDEFDGVLLSAIEEIDLISFDKIDGVRAEAYLKELWRKTFSKFAAIQETWLEQAFLRRGKAIVETMYPNQGDRRRFYQYGFTPYLGKRFDKASKTIRDALSAASRYGILSIRERCDIFIALAELISDDRGYGFCVREAQVAKDLLHNWKSVLRWWLNSPEAVVPGSAKLREWQRFVSENLEFRLGVAVSAVVARAWSDGTNPHQAIPSLDEWKENTGLPWFGFWVRELLKWGTSDPFVAFVLSQKLARTRSEALDRKPEFSEWLVNVREEISPEDRIDPQLFMKWQLTLQKKELSSLKEAIYQVELTGTDGGMGNYSVLPVFSAGTITWLDPTGYELGKSSGADWGHVADSYKNDFKMTFKNGLAVVRRVF